VDSTFYAAPSDSTYQAWAARTPGGFTFALKLPREITHEQALRGPRAESALAEFCRGARRLGPKLAAVLVQLPPQFEATRENLRALSEFLPLLPEDIRFAVEFRDPFWFEDELLVPLSLRRNVSLALVEGPWATRERVWRAAAPLLDTSNLDRWATAIERLRERGSAVYAYFSNFYEGHAPASANKLKRLLGEPVVTPEDLENQPSLF
jgi:uncharacterized protein YecE (DUF72 family)